MKRYALKGINDEQHECAVCGKVELKRVMWLVALDADGNQDGDAFHCGTTCGAKLLGYTQSKISTKVKNYAGEVSHKRYLAKCQKMEELGRSSLLKEMTGLRPAERIHAPQMKRIIEIEKEAAAYADGLEILIEM